MWWWLAGAALTLFGAKVVYDHWDDIKKWFANVLREVAQVIRQIGKRFGAKTRYATEVVAIVLEHIANRISIEHVLVYEESNKFWEERSRTETTWDKLPQRLKDKMRGKSQNEEVNIDREMEIETGLRA